MASFYYNQSCCNSCHHHRIYGNYLHEFRQLTFVWTKKLYSVLRGAIIGTQKKMQILFMSFDVIAFCIPYSSIVFSCRVSTITYKICAIPECSHGPKSDRNSNLQIYPSNILFLLRQALFITLFLQPGYGASTMKMYNIIQQNE